MSVKRRRFTAQFRAKVAMEAVKGQQTIDGMAAIAKRAGVGCSDRLALLPAMQKEPVQGKSRYRIAYAMPTITAIFRIYA